MLYCGYVYYVFSNCTWIQTPAFVAVWFNNSTPPHRGAELPFLDHHVVHSTWELDWERVGWETVGWQENLGLSPKRPGKYRHSESLSNPYYNAKLITCEEHKMLRIKPSKKANFPHQIANLLPIHLTYLDPVEIV